MSEAKRMESAAYHGSLDRVREANSALAAAISIMCERKTALPTQARKFIGHAACVLEVFCALQEENAGLCGGADAPSAAASRYGDDHA